MVKSMLVGLIHDKAIDLPSIAYDNGAATTLMSNDVDHLNLIVEIVHETWAYLLELVIGVFLLAKQIGWIWPLPLCLVFGKWLTQLLETNSLMCDYADSLASRSVFASGALRY